MADIPELNFTRRWTSASDFPSVEPDEAKARADMQSLFDETRNFINNKLIPGIKSGEIEKAELNDSGEFVLTKHDGSTVTVSVGASIVGGVEVNDDGELVATMLDGSQENLGRIGSVVEVNEDGELVITKPDGTQEIFEKAGGDGGVVDESLASSNISLSNVPRGTLTASAKYRVHAGRVDVVVRATVTPYGENEISDTAALFIANLPPMYAPFGAYGANALPSIPTRVSCDSMTHDNKAVYFPTEAARGFVVYLNEAAQSAGAHEYTVCFSYLTDLT